MALQLWVFLISCWKKILWNFNFFEYKIQKYNTSNWNIVRGLNLSRSEIFCTFAVGKNKNYQTLSALYGSSQICVNQLIQHSKITLLISGRSMPVSFARKLPWLPTALSFPLVFGTLSSELTQLAEWLVYSRISLSKPPLYSIVHDAAHDHIFTGGVCAVNHTLIQ